MVFLGLGGAGAPLDPLLLLPLAGSRQYIIAGRSSGDPRQLVPRARLLGPTPRSLSCFRGGMEVTLASLSPAVPIIFWRHRREALTGQESEPS